SYRLWHKEALEAARRLHAEHPFDLVHQVNYCGYREPGYTWKLGIPFVWGPIGGTQNFPLRFIGECDPWGALREVARNVANAWQLRTTRRVIAASQRAAAIVAATSCARSDLRAALGVEPTCQLETGISQIGPPRDLPERGRPFRILWAGRLRTWKGFPLMLKALRQLPAGLDYQVRG